MIGFILAVLFVATLGGIFESFFAHKINSFTKNLAKFFIFALGILLMKIINGDFS
tara:strand:- start:107 stop:271 length:165 start_codon:yes stop_codon:yes gene_type:complete